MLRCLRHFGIDGESPIVVGRGVKAHINPDQGTETLLEKIVASHAKIAGANKVVVSEGTGHIGVGSVVGMNNGAVAAALQTPVILVGKGGIGSSFDELAVNILACRKEGAEVAGVVLNKVMPEKVEMCEDYVGRCLRDAFGIPLLGTIPYDARLGKTSLSDIVRLFPGATLYEQKDEMQRHFGKEDLDILDGKSWTLRNRLMRGTLRISWCLWTF